MDEPVSDQASAASDHPAIALPAVAGPPPTGTDGHRARWWLFVVCLLGLLVGAAWVWTSEAGWRATCRLLSAVGGGQLSIRGASGSLGTAPAVAWLHWRSDTLDVQLEQLQVVWRPTELLRGRLAIARLAAARLRVAKLASSEVPAPPQTLRLPLAVVVDEVDIGRLEAGDYAHRDGKALTVAENLKARWHSDDEQHRVADLRAAVFGLAVDGELSLGVEPPFAVLAKAAVEGATGGRALAFDLSAEGPLTDIAVHGSARTVAGRAGEDFAGELQAHLTPFARGSYRSALVRLSGVDPAAWVDGAPRAALAVQIELQPLGDSPSELVGRLALVNRLAGTVDRQRLPLESLRSDLRLSGGELSLSALDAELLGRGRLQGSGRWQTDELALSLNAARLDAAVLHGALRRTQLAGALRATLALHRQTLAVDLRDARFAVAARMIADPAVLLVEGMRLSAGKAELRVDGRLALSGERAFAARGSLHDFDPSAFARLPTARLNATFDAEGHAVPLALKLAFALRDSRFHGQPLAGRGALEIVGRRLSQVAIELSAAGNRLTANGAFGAPSDRLNVVVAAPKLDSLGIVGDLDGRVLLGGTLAAPTLSGELRALRLVLPGLGELRGLQAQANLGEGAQGALAGQLRLASYTRAGGAGVFSGLSIEVEGVRGAHRLRAQAALAGEREMRLRLAGALGEQAGGLVWSGTLDELVFASLVEPAAPFVRLAAPLPWRIGGGGLALGAGELVGAGGWSARVESLRLTAAGWQSAGSVRGLPMARTLAEFSPSLAATLANPAGGEPLRLAGEWEFGPPATRSASGLPAGRLRLARESGDLAIGALALGLHEAQLDLASSDGRHVAGLRLRGARLGELTAQLSAAASARALLDRLAPWRGDLRLNAPDLAWLGPLLGHGWQLGGRLVGDVRLGGTPARPSLGGEWRGDDLALRALDQGMRLERGRLQARLAGGETPADLRLRLDELSFESDLQTMPRALQLAAGIAPGELTGKPGRFLASGELRLGQADAVLQLRAERLGVWQRPDQWLLVSGNGELALAAGSVAVVGQLAVDAAYWQLAGLSTPSLSEDVFIRRGGAQAPASGAPRLLSVDLQTDLGRNFHFRGAGVESRLVGALRLRAQGGEPLRASGSIRTRDGRFDAYGQKLEIERGIVNFQGLVDNPGLNIRAIRANLPVEAGVEVSGTARRPVVRLISDPPVPDAEKLSWLVLGHAPDQEGGQDAALLFAAGQAILGGQDGGPLKALQRSLGIDDFGISTGTLDGSGRRLTSRIASSSGFGSASTATGQIVSVGKRLSANLLLSYEQALNATGSVVKLTANLGRNLSVVGRAGSDNALDVFWTYRFGR
ncbi:MAG TPA: translocation/assembly module TamB domain-containing protein [Accumulibacter sp.]|uniref:translocation/assembly module TamB domain-containing protein n=1 Tax=Accumulibacter sp. TaxID=2053492 RepID=UPI002CEC5165|nr:translocation/assembly module TamB domain-containing protein [Accumulibacter sp.]HNM64926.1 translocation/assembly module TamB domain-containing protein [Accumulibacter sp.]HNN83993.1 translocation/assembly module TamB domain-containing protein [Accumulibacter sp.]